jgi:hypothetical protein
MILTYPQFSVMLEGLQRLLLGHQDRLGHSFRPNIGGWFRVRLDLRNWSMPMANPQLGTRAAEAFLAFVLFVVLVYKRRIPPR